LWQVDYPSRYAKQASRMIRVLFLMCLLVVSQTTDAAERTSFDRMDVFELEWVSSPQISPDGRRVVYNRNSMDIMTDRAASRLWIVRTDGSGNVPLTGRDVAESGAVWSPDGSRIAFTSATENGAEIHVHWNPRFWSPRRQNRMTRCGLMSQE